MHRLPSSYSVRRFRVAALLLLLKWPLIITSSLLLVFALVIHDQELTHIALYCASLAILIALAQWLVATTARCPLCLGLPLAHQNCVKHHYARRFLGSYRLHVATMIFVKGYYRCPYCGDTTAVSARQRHPKDAPQPNKHPGRRRPHLPPRQ